MKTNELTEKVIGCAIEVHKTLGPGLLETTYEQCFARELSQSGINFKIQVSLPVEYKGVYLDCGYINRTIYALVFLCELCALCGKNFIYYIFFWGIVNFNKNS